MVRTRWVERNKRDPAVAYQYPGKSSRTANLPALVAVTLPDAAIAQFPPSFSDYLQNKIRERLVNLMR